MSEKASNPALVVVDMLNPYDHEDAELLTRNVEPVVPRIRELLDRAREGGVEVIYVNDNYGSWNSSPGELAERACKGERPDLVEPILPPDDASFVIKARHTIFFETPLGYLVQQKEIDRLILTGQVTEQCILYSALDAYVRHIPIAVPRNAVAHIHEHLADAAIEMMEQNMDADVAVAEECEFR
ncbi:MAG: isochorismatase family cysteine hydrolase [Thermoleophilaceae bacterium]